MIPSKKTIPPKTRNLIPIIMGAGIFLILLSVLLLLFLVPVSRDVVPDNEVHLHADFALFLNGQKYDFSQEKYMDGPVTPVGNAVDMHDGDGDVIHVHAPHVTLGMFFESVGMKLETKDSPDGIGQEICFTDDGGNQTCYPRFGCYEVNEGQSLCVDPILSAQSWRLFVNGEQLSEDAKIEDYVLKDLDQLLLTNISFDGDLDAQLGAVTDKACIQSEKCPERGTPSDESSCVGSGECGVTYIA